MFLDVASQIFVVCGEGEPPLMAGAMWHEARDLFVYTCFNDICTMCVYGVFGYVMGKFPFDGGY